MDLKNTVLLKVSFSSLGNSAKVSASQIEVDADKDLIRVSKKLLDSPELEAIRSLDGEIRRYLYGLCLPFDTALHLLPTKLIETVEARLTDYRTQRQELVSLFVSAYPRLCQQAAIRLRGVYNPQDYSTREEVFSAFSMGWQYLTFDAPEALKQISTDLFNEERNKIAARMEDAYEQSRLLLRQTMRELVGHLRERLEARADGAAKRLHTTTLDGLKDFLRTFDLRNITDDAELSTIVAQAQNLLDPVEMESLRDSSRYAAEVAEDLRGIEEAIDANLLTDSPRRMVLPEDVPALA